MPDNLLSDPPLEVRPGKLVGHLIDHELQYRGIDGVNKQLKTIFRSEKQLLLAENGPRSSWAREVLAETTVQTTHAPKLSFNVHFTIGLED